MIAKLFSWLARSKHRSSWYSLPNDLILDICLRLEPATVIRCAGVCKSWRRAIIDNASILGPHLDHFLGPSLLLGVFHYDRSTASLRHTPGPFESALHSYGGEGNETPANSLMPATIFLGIPTLLSSKDGFILLKARSEIDSLCFCNPVTGYCTILPTAAAKWCEYILISCQSSSDDAPAVQILALHRREVISIMSLDHETLAYQLLSTSGDRARVWGPVVQSFGDHLEPGRRLSLYMDPQSTAVGRDTVYWLARPRSGLKDTCVLALDVRTGRTWTTELQMKCRHPSVLGMSGDGRLFLVQFIDHGPRIQVWVLSCDAQWTLHRTISIDKCNLPRRMTYWMTDLSTFCPRSRCVVALWSDQEILIDVDSSASSPLIRPIGERKEYHCNYCPYELDSSTYISKMKQF